MKKVLIADDEILVRVGLKSAVNWEENGYIVVAEAKNGKEAIAMFDKYSPDILITDISMPYMNGLELIQELKAKKQSLKIIILTHYDEFSYAQEAVELGVAQYILKSQLTPDNLLKTLKKISNEIDDSDDTLHSIQKESNVPIKKSIRDLEIYKIITEKVESQIELDRVLQKLDIQFTFNSFIVAYALMPLRSIENDHYKNNPEYLRKVLENISDQIITKSDLYVVVTVIKDSEIFYWFNFNENELQDNDAIEKITKIMISLKNNVKQFLDIQLSVGISSIGNYSIDINTLYNESKVAQECNFFDNTKIYVFNEKMKRGSGNMPIVDNVRLNKYVFDKNSSELNDFLEKIFEQLFIIKKIEYVRRIFIDLLNGGKLLYARLNNDSNPNILDLDYNIFDQLYNFDLIKKYIIEVYHHLFLCFQNQQVKQYSYIVKKSVHYIEQNYNKNISLSDVAQYVELSSSYLSFLFKKEKGINLISFLTEFRIEQAKIALAHSNKKMYEIAEQVGFDNPYYFSKIFKEITGITCKEYRKNYNM